MAPVRIDPHWRYHDLRAIVLENARLRLTLLPELGAKIYDLILKPADRNFLWHNPRLEPRRPVYGQNFDDWWCGGWDEVFPTCDVSAYRGETQRKRLKELAPKAKDFTNKRAYKNRPLTDADKQANRRKSAVRSKV